MVCLLAIRCYEPEMERLKRQKKYKEDSLQILSGDHIRILFRNARSGPFEAVISSGGAYWTGCMIRIGSAGIILLGTVRSTGP